ncbi:MAG TPA: SDR family oxidoreductase [Phycisphaerae bacterium]|nr:SDR family oxidoreductase [Phycisphaerae bacterium]
MDQQRVAIVTGASSGIGAETALAFARRGYAVVLAARRADRLEDVARQCERLGAATAAVPADVADRRQVDELVRRAADEFGRIDVMVNNAAFGVHGRVHEIDDRDMRDVFDVNFFGVFHGCKAVAPVMMGQRSGHIFNVSSVIGKRGTPFNGAYCATKFAVCGLTEAMRVEMAPYGVRVTLVCPGLTDTEFFRSVRGGRQRSRSSFARLRTLTPPAVVARKIAATVGKSTPELVFTPGGRFLALLSAVWPRAADRLLKLYHDDLVRSSK